eukprot:7454130-Pyramimonas_sp.AAC.1
MKCRQQATGRAQRRLLQEGRRDGVRHARRRVHAHGHVLQDGQGGLPLAGCHRQITQAFKQALPRLRAARGLRRS